MKRSWCEWWESGVNPPASKVFYGTEQSRRMIERYIDHSPAEIESMLTELAGLAGERRGSASFTALKTASESNDQVYVGMQT